MVDSVSLWQHTHLSLSRNDDIHGQGEGDESHDPAHFQDIYGHRGLVLGVQGGERSVPKRPKPRLGVDFGIHRTFED